MNRNAKEAGEMKKAERAEVAAASGPARGLAAWLLDRLRRGPRAQPRLALVERIALAPRQSLSLIEAEGRRLLVATSPDGSPCFYALDEDDSPGRQMRTLRTGSRAGRISW